MLGMNGYQPLILFYIGKGLRESLIELHGSQWERLADIEDRSARGRASYAQRKSSWRTISPTTGRPGGGPPTPNGLDPP